nr:MAG TPA_asm: ethylene-responsive transcription factor [Caudoviricetes sp.]
MWLGCFDTLEEAIAVRKEAEKRFGYHENHGR